MLLIGQRAYTEREGIKGSSREGLRSSWKVSEPVGRASKPASPIKIFDCVLWKIILVGAAAKKIKRRSGNNEERCGVKNVGGA